VEHATGGVAALLGEHTPEDGCRLREPLAGWLRDQRERAVPVPLRLAGCSARVVRGVGPGVDAIVLAPAGGALSVQALHAVGLTRREADVLALVADGLTNAGIGMSLGISERTVAKHVQHVNEKLGVGSRTAAAARARELVTGQY
jgi:DNA-binding CsgD family transcriptional regulator